MSERGSFVTEYIYCSNCLDVCKSVLLSNKKYCCSRLLYSWESGYLPIIAGKIGGMHESEELLVFESLCDEIKKNICCTIRIAVLAEKGDNIFTITPSRVIKKGREPKPTINPHDH